MIFTHTKTTCREGEDIAALLRFAACSHSPLVLTKRDESSHIHLTLSHAQLRLGHLGDREAT